jgi:hypothetical protein
MLRVLIPTRNSCLFELFYSGISDLAIFIDTRPNFLLVRAKFMVLMGDQI